MAPADSWTTLLIVHLLVGVTLLGAITHQALAFLLSAPRNSVTFITWFREVAPRSYATVIVLLYATQAALGAWIYAKYYISARPPMERSEAWTVIGAFQWKVDIVTIGIGALPAYWYFWKRQPLASEHSSTRNWLTAMLAAIVWYAFLIGRLAVNVQGFSS